MRFVKPLLLGAICLSFIGYPFTSSALIIRAKVEEAAPKVKPVVILWLVVQSGQEKHLLGVDTDPSITDLIKYLSEPTGLEVFVPLLDLTDLSSLSADDVWNKSVNALQTASNRYGYENILVGKLSQKQDHDGFWNVEWDLLNKNQEKSWKAEDVTIVEALKSGVQGTANQLTSLSTQPSTT